MTRVDFTQKITQLFKEMVDGGELFFGDYWLRSPEEQMRLFAKGRIKKDDKTWEIVDKSKVVTYQDGVTKVGGHIRGTAIDVYFTDIKGNPIYAECSKEIKDKYYKWHKVWEEKYGGKPPIGDWDLVHFEG